jgi:hypothetical protein
MLRWPELVWMSDEQLDRYDLVEKNLACAFGLPGTDGIDVAACVDKVNEIARYCRAWTDHHFYYYHQDPADFNHSVAYFKSLCLDSAMKQGFGIRYNPAHLENGVMKPDAKFQVADCFLHGLLFGEGGMCGTMPVLYAAVGRRLGYPIKLVSASTKTVGHLFARWDGDGERFNIETTNGGMSSNPDEYYRTGMYELEEKEYRLGCLLQSKTPRQELAGFMAHRAYCWLDAKNDREACRAFLWAFALNPANRHMYNRVGSAMNDWVDWLRSSQSPGFPEVRCGVVERRLPDSVPLDLERDFSCLEGWATILADPDFERAWWGPMRRGEWLPRWPTRALCDWTRNQMGLRFEYITWEEAQRRETCLTRA